MDKGLPTIQQFCLPLYFLTYLFTNVHKEILKNMLIVVTFTTENLGDNTHTHTYTHTHTHTYIYFIIKSEKAMLHSSVLAWRIPGTGELGGLLSMGSHRVGQD